MLVPPITDTTTTTTDTDTLYVHHYSGRRLRWYGLAQWQKRRAHQLREFPLCATCLTTKGLPVPATVADHVRPHQGDSQSFWFGELQSLCKYCHDSTKQIEEAQQQGRRIKQITRRLGYRPGYGDDGWPIDPNHPAYATRSGKGAASIANNSKPKFKAGQGGAQKPQGSRA